MSPTRRPSGKRFTALQAPATLTAALVGEGSVALGFHLAAYLAGGWFAAHEVWERLQHRVLDVHFLMLAVALGSALIGHWDEGAMLLFLFSISGALEHYAMGRTQREIGALFKAAPKTATLLDDAGHEHEVPVAELQPGARLLIKPGAQFPLDAEIIRHPGSVVIVPLTESGEVLLVRQYRHAIGRHAFGTHAVAGGQACTICHDMTSANPGGVRHFAELDTPAVSSVNKLPSGTIKFSLSNASYPVTGAATYTVLRLTGAN